MELTLDLLDGLEDISYFQGKLRSPKRLTFILFFITLVF